MTEVTKSQSALPESLESVARTPGATGDHEFATLLAEVSAETTLKPHAVNHATGAAGPFQFIANTWLALARSHGAAIGIKPELVAKIALDHAGHPVVSDAAAKRDLLDLRFDPVIAARMAAAYLDQARQQMKQGLHRDPNEAEVHLGYLLGPQGATRLIRAAAETPEKPVDEVVGSAANANRSLFHEANGGMRATGEALAFLEGKYHRDKEAAVRMTAAVAPPPVKADA
jgi:hypothetical protein